MEANLLAQVDISKIWKFAPDQNSDFSTLGSIVSFFLPKVLLVAGLIAFILTVGAGFAVIASAGGGDPHNTEKAKGVLTYSVIGFILIFGAYWLVQIISFLTNNSLEKIIGP
jgi:hypothetical protein